MSFYGRGRSASADRTADSSLARQRDNYERLLGRGREIEVAFKEPLSEHRHFATSRPLSSSELEQVLHEEKKKRQITRMEQVRAKESLNAGLRRENFEAVRKGAARRIAHAWGEAGHLHRDERLHSMPPQNINGWDEQFPTTRVSPRNQGRHYRHRFNSDQYSAEDSLASTSEEKDDASEERINGLRALYQELEQQAKDLEKLGDSLRDFKLEGQYKPKHDNYEREPKTHRQYLSQRDLQKDRSGLERSLYAAEASINAAKQYEPIPSPRISRRSVRPYPVQRDESNHRNRDVISHSDQKYEDPIVDLHENDVVYIDDNGIRLQKNPDAERMATTTWFALAEEELSAHSSVSPASERTFEGKPEAALSKEGSIKKGIRLDLYDDAIDSRFLGNPNQATMATRSRNGSRPLLSRSTEALIQRLQSGERVRVGREEMLDRTRRAVAKLPEVSAARREAQKREEEERRRKLVQVMDLERRERLLLTQHQRGRGRSRSFTAY